SRSHAHVDAGCDTAMAREGESKRAARVHAGNVARPWRPKRNERNTTSLREGPAQLSRPAHSSHLRWTENYASAVVLRRRSQAPRPRIGMPVRAKTSPAGAGAVTVNFRSSLMATPAAIAPKLACPVSE